MLDKRGYKFLMFLALLLSGCNGQSESSIAESSSTSSQQESSSYSLDEASSTSEEALSTPSSSEWQTSENETSQEQSTSKETASESSSLEKHQLQITYTYGAGNVISVYRENYYEGESYSIESPEEEFMVPDKQRVSGTMGENDINLLVNYTYGPNCLEEIEIGNTYSWPYYDESDSMSFSFLVSNILYEDQLLCSIGAVDFRADCIIYNDTSAFYFSSSYYGSGRDSGELLCPSDQNRLVTIKISAGSFAYYLNGSHLVTVANAQAPDEGSLYPYEVAKIAIEEVKAGKLTFGLNSSTSPTFSDLYLGLGMENEDIQAIYDQYDSIQINYVDMEGRKLIHPSTYLGHKGETYQIQTPEIPGYLCEESASGTLLGGHQVSGLPATFNGSETLSEPITLDMGNTYGWTNQDKWIKYASSISGDFRMKLELNNQSAIAYPTFATGGTICWRTVLPIVYGSSTGDRWVCRLDWYGWLNDVNGDGRTLGDYASHNDGYNYAGNYDYGLYYLYKDLDISILYTREGGTLTMDCRLFPQYGGYKGLVYSYTCVLEGITEESLSFALAAEDAIVTLKSVMR